MTISVQKFPLTHVHPSWHPCLENALSQVNPDYLDSLSRSNDWLPGRDKLFNAFSLPFDQVNYILFGESPYPRAASANGYAFWDAKVDDLWSPTGLSKTVNRATSLRNFIKMLLIAEGLLDPGHTTQPDIALLSKASLVQTGQALFGNFLSNGILLLNATLVLQPQAPIHDAREWQPFVKKILDYIYQHRPAVHCLLFGKIAEQILPLLGEKKSKSLVAEHPYNISFIHNQGVCDFFKPLHLIAFNA